MSRLRSVLQRTKALLENDQLWDGLMAEAELLRSESANANPAPTDALDGDDGLSASLMALGFHIPYFEGVSGPFMDGNYLVIPGEHYEEVRLLLATQELFDQIRVRRKWANGIRGAFEVMDSENGCRGHQMMPECYLGIFRRYAVQFREDLKGLCTRESIATRSCTQGYDVAAEIREVSSIAGTGEDPGEMGDRPEQWLAQSVNRRPDFKATAIGEIFDALYLRLSKEQADRKRELKVLDRALERLGLVGARLLRFIPKELHNLKEPPAQKIHRQLIDMTMCDAAAFRQLAKVLNLDCQDPESAYDVVVERLFELMAQEADLEEIRMALKRSPGSSTFRLVHAAWEMRGGNDLFDDIRMMFPGTDTSDVLQKVWRLLESDQLRRQTADRVADKESESAAVLELLTDQYDSDFAADVKVAREMARAAEK